MALAEVYGAEDHFPLPKAERAILAVRNARIARAYETHKTARELAAENNLTERQIERILSAAGVTAPVDRRQGSLSLKGLFGGFKSVRPWRGRTQ